MARRLLCAHSTSAGRVYLQPGQDNERKRQHKAQQAKRDSNGTTLTQRIEQKAVEIAAYSFMALISVSS
jgi:hypothetical protein